MLRALKVSPVSYTSIYLLSYSYMSVLILYLSSYTYMSVLMLLYICPHTLTVSVLILLYTCSHTPIFVSSFFYVHVLILLCMCPRTTIYVSSYYSLARRHLSWHSHSFVVVASLLYCFAALLLYTRPNACIHQKKPHAHDIMWNKTKIEYKNKNRWRTSTIRRQRMRRISKTVT